MKRSWCRGFFRLFQLIIFAFAGFGCNQTVPNPTVIAVNDSTVHLDEYLDQYAHFLRSTSLQDNLRSRHLFTDALVDEILFLSWADSVGLLAHAVHQRELQAIDDQLLLNRLYQVEIRDKLTIPEAAFRRSYRWSKIDLHTRHLYAKDRIAADHLYERLRTGERWEDLARETFRDPVLASNGGDLGFASLGDLDPAYEVMAYQLADGEISPPVLTKTGYSIIQVIERNYDPFLIEEDFQAQREKLRQIIMTHLKRPSVRAYTDSILWILHPRYYRGGLQQVLTQFDVSVSRGVEYPARGLADTVVVFEGPGNSWTVGEVLDRLGQLAPRHQRRLVSEDDLEGVISGLLVQEHMLAEARAGIIAEDEEFRRESHRAKKSYAIAQVLNHIISGAKPEESELKEYYRDHRDELVSERRFEVLEIVVTDSDTAGMIRQQLLAGEQFAVLARRYSLRKETAERGGYLGWGTPQQFGGIRSALEGTNVGDLLGPLHLNGLEIIVKVLDIVPSVPLTLEEARPIIEERLATQTRRREYDRFRQTLLADADIRVDSTRIREFIFTEVGL